MNDLQKMMRVFQEVAEKTLDPVGKEDGDIDNDGDTDSSDSYLKNRRKKIGQAMGKDKKESYGKKKESVGESKVECPKCEGKGCSHCDDKGYHMKEDTEMDQYIDAIRQVGSKDIVELSNKTMGSYVKKAAKSATDAGRTAGVSDMAGNSKAAMKGYDTLTKRQKGINRAVDKMTREEAEQVDELSTDTLTSYISKASKSNPKLSAAQKDKRYDGVATASKKVDKKLRAESMEVDEAMGDAQHKAAVKHVTDLGKKHGRSVGQQRMHIDNHPHKYDKETHAHAKTINKNQFGGWKVGKDGKTTQKESIEDTLASIKGGDRKVMKWTQFSEDYDEINFKKKKRPQDMEIGQSSIRDMSAEKHTKGATPPEGIMDKESEKSKKFYKDHQKSDPEWENKEDQGHDDVSKAGRGGPSGPSYRKGDNKAGDKQIINKPTQKY